MMYYLTGVTAAGEFVDTCSEDRRKLELIVKQYGMDPPTGTHMIRSDDDLQRHVDWVMPRPPLDDIPKEGEGTCGSYGG